MWGRLFKLSYKPPLAALAAERQQDQAREIKGIADLVPYHKSLKELWAREEFQPVLGLLASLRADAEMEVKRANIERPAEDCKAALAMIRIKLNLLDSFT